jgi:serine/threonine protein kinase
MMLNEGESIVRCYDSYDFQNRLWVVQELMDGDLLTVITKHRTKVNKCSYSEEFVKYMVLNVLKGILFLHER